jgi:hypothetical protein
LSQCPLSLRHLNSLIAIPIMVKMFCIQIFAAMRR